MKRRKFLKITLAFLGSVTSASFAYSLLKFLVAIPAKAVDSKKIMIHKSEVPYGGAKNIIYGDTPVIIINRPEKGFIAFSRTCTHLGCLIEFSKSNQKIICPCHAGTYDLDGLVEAGPPPRPLTTIPLKIEGDTIIIG
ncbi:MAG: ubiquinol-cytochrome c reductase iron-sulfur subunit [Betaproteobacteria bacterium]